MQPLLLPLSSIESNQEPYFAPTLIIPMLASFMRNINNVGYYSITSSNVRASPASEKNEAETRASVGSAAHNTNAGEPCAKY